MRVGCATRTVDETVAIGREDVTVRTAVLMARFLCGDGEFFHVFADVIRRELLPDAETGALGWASPQERANGFDAVCNAIAQLPEPPCGR